MARERVECGAGRKVLKMHDENGSAPDGKVISQVIITLDRESFTMTFGGRTANFDEAISMCQTAIRYFDAKIRAAQVAQVLHGQAQVPFDIGARRNH